MGLFRRRRREPDELSRELYHRTLDARVSELADAAAGVRSGDRRVQTNALYAIGHWHAKVFGEACDTAFHKARLRPPPQPYVDVERSVLIFGDTVDEEYTAMLRELARRLELDPDEVVAADERRQRFMTSEGLRRDIDGLLGRFGSLDREEAALHGSLLLARAQEVSDQARDGGVDALLAPELGELSGAIDRLRQAAMAYRINLDPNRARQD